MAGDQTLADTRTHFANVVAENLEVLDVHAAAVVDATGTTDDEQRRPRIWKLERADIPDGERKLACESRNRTSDHHPRSLAETPRKPKLSLSHARTGRALALAEQVGALVVAVEEHRLGGGTANLAVEPPEIAQYNMATVSDATGDAPRTGRTRAASSPRSWRG